MWLQSTDFWALLMPEVCSDLRNCAADYASLAIYHIVLVGIRCWMTQHHKHWQFYE